MFDFGLSPRGVEKIGRWSAAVVSFPCGCVGGWTSTTGNLISRHACTVHPRPSVLDECRALGHRWGRVGLRVTTTTTRSYCDRCGEPQTRDAECDGVPR